MSHGHGLDLIRKNYGASPSLRERKSDSIENQCVHSAKILNMESDLSQLQSLVGRMMSQIQDLTSQVNAFKENPPMKTKLPVKTTKQLPQTNKPQRPCVIDTTIKHLGEEEIEKYKRLARERAARNPPKVVEDVECKKCKTTANPSLMWKEFDQTKGAGVVSYTCSNYKECSARANPEKTKFDKLQSQYKHLDKEDQLREIYGLEMDDLEEIPFRTRDASIHYQYIPNDEENDEEENDEKIPKLPTRVIWCWATKSWSSRKIED